jgi:hypothetical protein
MVVMALFRNEPDSFRARHQPVLCEIMDLAARTLETFGDAPDKHHFLGLLHRAPAAQEEGSPFGTEYFHFLTTGRSL